MTEPENKLNILIIGAGDRGNLFANLAINYNAKVVAVADPVQKRRELMAETCDIPLERIFSTGEKALKSGLPFDAVYIASPDKSHYRQAKLALKRGYNVLLEKPMSTTAKECINLIKEQEKSGKTLAIFHVLRYAPFFQEIKKILDSGELGKVLNIDLEENIGYWHFAHSFVRGNWRKEEGSSPIILAKSCHDLDIIAWLADSEPEMIYSTGSLKVFKPENAPATSTERCTDGCPVKDCIYDARKFYLNHKEVKWPYRVISPEDTSESARLKALQEGQYGRCVFKCGNDVLDNQEVIIEFENGIKANFLLRMGGEQPTRRITIQCEKGEISGNLWKGKINKVFYTGRREEIVQEEISTEELGSHGGGDPRLVKDFLNTIRSQSHEESLTSAKKSLQSHLIAFASEISRKLGRFGKPIKYKTFLDKLVTTRKYKKYRGKNKRYNKRLKKSKRK